MTPARDPFPPQKWWARRDRSREPLWDFTDLTGMFGMTELEIGVADIMNKARASGCLLADVYFERTDLTSDKDAFRELGAHGWLIQSDGRYRLDGEAVQRVHRRYPNV
jgi:hypothetical protein